MQIKSFRGLTSDKSKICYTCNMAFNITFLTLWLENLSMTNPDWLTNPDTWLTNLRFVKPSNTTKGSSSGVIDVTDLSDVSDMSMTFWLPIKWCVWFSLTFYKINKLYCYCTPYTIIYYQQSQTYSRFGCSNSKYK